MKPQEEWELAISDRDFQVTLRMTYGASCNAVFFYQKETAHLGGDAARLATAFDTAVVEAIAAVLNNQVALTTIEVVNLADVFDYDTRTPTDTVGDVAATSPGPRFLAYSFQYTRTRRDGRHGYKRFPGVAEELVAGESTSVGAPLTTMIPLLEAALEGSISSGGASFRPMIQHKELVTMPDLSERYVLTDLYNVGNVVFRGLTTQNTRKA